jgi:hypothetical protein
VELPLRELAVAGLVLSSLLAAGCREQGQGQDAGLRPQVAGGLHVALPPGWTAEVDTNDALVIGPPGKPVLKIAHPSDGNELPSSKNLSRVFTQEMEGTRVTTLKSEDRDGGSLWIGRVETPNSWEVAFGARRIQGEVFLCATLPGASTQEVRDAARLCESLGDKQR